MGIVTVNDSTLTDIADAIREKLSVQKTYKPSEMADAIESISGGGITPTGTISITENDTYDVTQYASAEVNVSGGSPTGTKSITANGTGIDVAAYAYADVAVPNTYAAGDEGKVVSNGALVSQTSDTVTANDTYDTTLINSLTVNVASGGSSVPSWVTSTETVTIGANSVTKMDAVKSYFSSYEPYAIAFLKTSPDTSNQCVALFGLSCSQGLRYRNNTVSSAMYSGSYDGKLIEGTQYEIWHSI